MPTWYYFSRPSNMAFHDFTKRHKPQKNLRSLLGLGLKFIPTSSLTNCWSRLKQSSYDRLLRSVHLRFHFARKPPSEGTTTYDPKIYVHSTWTPPHWTIPPIALEERLTRFSLALSKLFKTRQGKTNLLPHQHRALRTLQQQQTFLIVPCDKNLGPAIIERHDYLKIAMRDHLSDTTTYKSLTTSEIDCYSSDITKNILGWMKTHHKKLTKMERAFLRKKLKSNHSPYARFYLTLKAHKLKPGQTVDDLDDVIGIWCPHHNHEQDTLKWDHFKNKMNAFPGLTWEFRERAKTINFMDMTISINKSNCIETTLFEKRLNLNLYIHPPPPPPPPPTPPHSAHPPGLLPRIVYGTLFRIFTLCSDNEDKLQRTKVFLSASLPVATKETKSDRYSTKPLRVQKHTVDHHKMRPTTTTASSSTYRFIQTIPHLPVSRQNGEHMSPNLNGNCPWNT